MTNSTERLQELLISNIEKASASLGKGFNFAVEQSPILIQEILNYEFYSKIDLLLYHYLLI